MTASILNGTKIAASIREELKNIVDDLSIKGIKPGLAVVQVGNDDAAVMYTRMKEKAAREIGIDLHITSLPEKTGQQEFSQVIQDYNRADGIDGILLQLPLPGHLNKIDTFQLIDPAKDVDALNLYNAGCLLHGRPGLRPCTPAGCMTILERSGIDVQGMKAVVIGRSNIVGKPLAMLLLQNNATVTICHSGTVNLKKETRQADLVMVAMGKAEVIDSDYLKPGCIVVDIGQHLLKNGKIVGDVDFASAAEVAAWITPVPGGVGPMTVAMLMSNTIIAARIRRGNPS